MENSGSKKLLFVIWSQRTCHLRRGSIWEGKTQVSAHTKQNGTEVKISSWESSFLLGFITVLAELPAPFQICCEVTLWERALGWGDAVTGFQCPSWNGGLSLIPDHLVNLKTEHPLNLAILFRCKGVRKIHGQLNSLGVMALSWKNSGLLWPKW